MAVGRSKLNWPSCGRNECHDLLDVEPSAELQPGPLLARYPFMITMIVTLTLLALVYGLTWHNQSAREIAREPQGAEARGRDE